LDLANKPIGLAFGREILRREVELLLEQDGVSFLSLVTDSAVTRLAVVIPSARKLLASALGR
jgi:hypothetical protein